MKGAATFGRLVVSDDYGDPFAQPVRMTLLQKLTLVFILLGLAFLVLWSLGMLWGPLGPRKMVVRGCELLSVDTITSKLDFTGEEGVPMLWMRARQENAGGDRWLKRMHVGPDWGRVAVVDVTERRPLLTLKADKSAYWLCDDGWLVARDENDGQVVDVPRLSKLPVVIAADDPGPGPWAAAEDVLFTASALDQLMPGLFGKIEVARNGSFMIYEKSGFPVKLGEPEYLAEKLGALPKALRVCEDHKDQLRYLDASDHNLFYEKWKEAQQ